MREYFEYIWEATIERSVVHNHRDSHTPKTDAVRFDRSHLRGSADRPERPGRQPHSQLSLMFHGLLWTFKTLGILSQGYLFNISRTEAHGCLRRLFALSRPRPLAVASRSERRQRGCAGLRERSILQTACGMIRLCPE